MNQRYPSALLENAVNELASLPGVGRKTALRLALYMLRRDVGYTERIFCVLASYKLLYWKQGFCYFFNKKFAFSFLYCYNVGNDMG